MFGSPIEKAPASPSSEAPVRAPGPYGGVDVGTVGNGKGEADDRSDGVSCDNVDATESLGVMTGKGYKAGQDGDADDRYYFLMVFFIVIVIFNRFCSIFIYVILYVYILKIQLMLRYGHFSRASIVNSRMDLNDSSELADPLRGLSLRDATSSPGTRRLSSGSLLDLVSEVRCFSE